MSDPDWKRRPQQGKEKAEKYLKKRGFDGVDIHELARAEPKDSGNEHFDMLMNTRTAEIVAVAQLWVLADAVLTLWDLGDTEATLELMYGLGRYEAMAKVFAKMPGAPAGYAFREDAHLIFSDVLNNYIFGSLESRRRAKVKRKKQLEPDESLYRERDDTLCELFDEVKRQVGSPTHYAGKVAKEYNRIYYSKFPPFDTKIKFSDGRRCGRPLKTRQIKNILIKRGKILKSKTKKPNIKI